jgi:hypothetical protein
MRGDGPRDVTGGMPENQRLFNVVFKMRQCPLRIN